MNDKPLKDINTIIDKIIPGVRKSEFVLKKIEHMSIEDQKEELEDCIRWYEALIAKIKRRTVRIMPGVSSDKSMKEIDEFAEVLFKLFRDTAFFFDSNPYDFPTVAVEIGEVEIEIDAIESLIFAVESELKIFKNKLTEIKTTNSNSNKPRKIQWLGTQRQLLTAVYFLENKGYLAKGTLDHIQAIADNCIVDRKGKPMKRLNITKSEMKKNGEGLEFDETSKRDVMELTKKLEKNKKINFF